MKNSKPGYPFQFVLPERRRSLLSAKGFQRAASPSFAHQQSGIENNHLGSRQTDHRNRCSKKRHLPGRWCVAS